MLKKWCKFDDFFMSCLNMMEKLTKEIWCKIFHPTRFYKVSKLKMPKKRIFDEVKNESFTFGLLYIQNIKNFEAKIHWVLIPIIFKYSRVPIKRVSIINKDPGFFSIKLNEYNLINEYTGKKSLYQLTSMS